MTSLTRLSGQTRPQVCRALLFATSTTDTGAATSVLPKGTRGTARATGTPRQTSMAG